MSASKTRSGGAKGGRGRKSQPGKGQGRNHSGGDGTKQPASRGLPASPSPPASAVTAPPTTVASETPAPGTAKPTATLARAKLKTSKGAAPRSTSVTVRHIDPRSALRMSALFYLSMSLALFVAGALLWIGANAVGLVGNIEAFMDEIGFTDFQLRTGQFLKASLIAGFVLTVGGSAANLLMAVLYNLLSDTFGGIKVVLGEDHRGTKA